MSKEFKEKLLSRKFLTMVVSFVTAILIFFNVDRGSVESIGSLMTLAGTIIAYLLGQGFVDGKAVEGNATITTISDSPTQTVISADKE